MEQGFINEIVQNILKFLNTAEHADVKFQVKCGHCWYSFLAHKLILSIWSPVLAKEFAKVETHVEDDTDVIEITDISLAAFDALLKFMYGSLDEIEKNKNNVKFVLNVYKAAKIYKIKQVENICVELLVKPDNLSPDKDNVFELLDAAIYVEDENLKLRCLKFIQTYTEEVIKSRNLQTVTPDMILTVLKLPCVSLSSEYELASWVFNWANSILIQNIEAEKYKDIIKPFLPYINFIALEPQQFATLVSENKTFFDERECFLIFMNISLPGSAPIPNWHLKSECKREFNGKICEIKKKIQSMDLKLRVPPKTKSPSFNDVVHCNSSSISYENKDANSECENGVITSFIEQESITSVEKNVTNGYEFETFSTTKGDDESHRSSVCVEKSSYIETMSNNISDKIIIGHASSTSDINNIKDDSVTEIATHSTENHSVTSPSQCSISCAEIESNNLSSEIVIGHAQSSSNRNHIKDTPVVETEKKIVEGETISNHSHSSGDKVSDFEIQKKIFSTTIHKKLNRLKEGRKNSTCDILNESLVGRKKIGKTKTKKFQLNQEFVSLPCASAQIKVQDTTLSSDDKWVINVSKSFSGFSQMI